MACGVHECCNAGNVNGIGCGAIGKFCLREFGEDVLARLAPPLLDVLDEPLLFHANEAAAFAFESARYRRAAEPLSVGCGDAEQVGNCVQCERKVVVEDDLAPTLRGEAVELLVGKTPQEVFVVLEPLRGK